MRYLPSDNATSAVQNAAEDELFDVTEQATTPAGKIEDAPPYELQTPKLAKKVGRFFWHYLSPRTNGYHRSLAALAGIAASAFLLAWLLSWIIGSLPVLISVIAFGIIGAILGGVLLTASGRSGDDTLYGRVHLAILIAGAMTIAGWLPARLLITILAPMGVGYGFGSFAALIASALRTPSAPQETSATEETKSTAEGHAAQDSQINSDLTSQGSDLAEKTVPQEIYPIQRG